MKRYLAILGVPQQRPGIEQLSLLIRRHLERIPYETLSKFYYYNQSESVPGFDTFVDRLVEKGWGGNCYTLNINFGRLLQKIGYTVDYVLVDPGHIALKVELNGDFYYVDVGYGSPLFKPVLLESEMNINGGSEQIAFTKFADSLFEIDRKNHQGKSFVKKTIYWEPQRLTSFEEDIAASHRDEDENNTMRRITMTQFKNGNCYFLRNETLTVMNQRSIRTYSYDNEEEWLEAVKATYGTDKEIGRDALSFLDERGVTFFL